MEGWIIEGYFRLEVKIMGFVLHLIIPGCQAGQGPTAILLIRCENLGYMPGFYGEVLPA